MHKSPGEGADIDFDFNCHPFCVIIADEFHLTHFDTICRHATRRAGDLPSNASPQASHDVFGNVGEGYPCHMQEIHAKCKVSPNAFFRLALTIHAAVGDFRRRRDQAYTPWLATALCEAGRGSEEPEAERAPRLFGVQSGQLLSRFPRCL